MRSLFLFLFKLWQLNILVFQLLHHKADAVHGVHTVSAVNHIFLNAFRKKLRGDVVDLEITKSSALHNICF